MGLFCFLLLLVVVVCLGGGVGGGGCFVDFCMEQEPDSWTLYLIRIKCCPSLTLLILLFVQLGPGPQHAVRKAIVTHSGSHKAIVTHSGSVSK